jgi:hypothetical protein
MCMHGIMTNRRQYNPISVAEDDGYHVAGALVVAPERAMPYAIAQLYERSQNAATFQCL